MVQNIQESKNPGGSNHFEQHVHKVSWSTQQSQTSQQTQQSQQSHDHDDDEDHDHDDDEDDDHDDVEDHDHDDGEKENWHHWTVGCLECQPKKSLQTNRGICLIK